MGKHIYPDFITTQLMGFTEVILLYQQRRAVSVLTAALITFSCYKATFIVDAFTVLQFLVFGRKVIF